MDGTLMDNIREVSLPELRKKASSMINQTHEDATSSEGRKLRDDAWNFLTAVCDQVTKAFSGSGVALT